MKQHNPDYRHISIDDKRINSIPRDGDIIKSLTVILDPVNDESDIPDDVLEEHHRYPPVNTQSMAKDLNATTIEFDLIRRELVPQLTAIPALSIHLIPLDEASGKEYLFSMAFSTLFPTGCAEFIAPQLRKVNLHDYARHMLCYHNGRLSRHPRWRFSAFNVLLRTNSFSAARIYVFKASRFNGLNREELADALERNKYLVTEIVRQGPVITGTPPFWSNKSNSLLAQAQFLSADMQNTSDQFLALVNRLQENSNYTPNYCMRIDRKIGKFSCRFFFPRPLFSDAIVTREINPKSWLISPARNDSLFSQRAPVITIGWRAT